jgi:hypothetical protein
MICKCKNIIPDGRVNLGYKVCVNCSAEWPNELRTKYLKK